MTAGSDTYVGIEAPCHQILLTYERLLCKTRFGGIFLREIWYKCGQVFTHQNQSKAISPISLDADGRNARGNPFREEFNENA